MPQVYVGLDGHSKQSVYVVENETGKVMGRGEVPTTPEGLYEMVRRHALPAGTKVALETGTVAFYIARQLRKHGLEPVVVDAHEVRLKAHRPQQKSDRRDAYELCEGLRGGIYRSIVHVPPQEISHLRESLSRRRHFVRLRTAEVNAVKRLLRAAGLGHLARSLSTEAAWDKLLSQMPASEMNLRSFIAQHRAAWSCAGAQIDALEADLEAQQVPFREDLELAQTVPGVGPIVALTVVAVFSDVKRFRSAKHAASYTGITPSTSQSADRDTHGHITKRGSAELRAMLCEAAHHARKPTHPLNPYFAKVCAKRGYKAAIVAVAHRLCRILYALLRHRTPFDPTRLGIEIGPFEKRIVRPYRLRPRQKAIA